MHHPVHKPADMIREAEAAAASVTDPDLRKIAFEKGIDLIAAHPPSPLETISRLTQVMVVVAGVIISVLSFNATRKSEARARLVEAESQLLELQRFQDQRSDEAADRHAEAAKPFLELRQNTYLEAVKSAAILANPETHSEDEVAEAKTRFRDLYVAELSLVEGIGVEQKMVALAKIVDPELEVLDAKRRAAYDLAHALRDSLKKSWNLRDEIVDNPDD